MAIGPKEAEGGSGDSAAMIAGLERRIDVWLQNGWATGQNSYLLPFWVFLRIHRGEFDKMVARYRNAGWTSVWVETDSSINVHRLVFVR